SLQAADLVHDIAANAPRVLPVELVERARDDVLRRPVERRRDRAVLVRPVGGEDLVGPAPQEHVERTGDRLVDDPAQGVVPEGHGPAAMSESVARILLWATGRLHDAVHRDLGNGDDLSHVTLLSLPFGFQSTRTLRARSLAAIH